MKSKQITRNCLVCDKELKINVFEDGSYDTGHYFGKVQLEVGEGERKIIGESDIFGKNEKVLIYEWTGNHEEIEYWECDDCSKEI